MRLDASRALVAEGQPLPVSVTIALPSMVVLGEQVTFPHLAEFSGTMVRLGDSLHLEGALNADAHVRCARCLVPCQIPLEVPVEAAFVPLDAPEDPDVYRFDGASVEIGVPLEDATLLALPMRFLCKDDCEGLCPRCGVNQNQAECACPTGDDESEV